MGIYTKSPHLNKAGKKAKRLSGRDLLFPDRGCCVFIRSVVPWASTLVKVPEQKAFYKKLLILRPTCTVRGAVGP